MAKKVQLQTNGKEWQVIDGVEVYVDVEKQDIDPITSSSCVQIEGFRTLEEAVSDNKMLSQDLTYTKVMDKVGGDYHQNVLDGQYSKAILYGNTQVNLCEEDSSNALQIPTTFTSFNNGELQIKNKESQVVAPLIKGVTMVNLAQINSMLVESGRAVPVQNVKGNTLYTLSFTFTTKNTNSGVVIECYDVNGEYLGNVMHKTGLGDVAKFTFTTHANATKVHICNNAAYGGETIQLDDIMLIEGDQTALDIPFFKGMKSVELVRPLTNLFTNDTSTNTHNATVTNSNGTVTVTSTHSSAWSAGSFLLNTSLKPNTKYLVMWDNLEYTQTSTAYLNEIIGVYVANGNTKISYINNDLLCPTKRSLIFDTKSYQLDGISLRIHATLLNTETGTTTVTGLRVFEYDDYLRSVDLQSIGWFSGTKNVAVEPVKTYSKNLYPYGDINFTPTKEMAWHDAKGNSQMFGDIAQKSKSRFLLKKGTYTFNWSNLVNIEGGALQIATDVEKVIMGSRPITFTLEDDTYCTIRVKSLEANTVLSATNIQIERGETATDYVAHDSRYYEPDGQNAIVLRSLPSGVCDTFNLQTGEYIQRINEVVFDGSEDENWNAVSKTPWTQNGYYAFEYLVQTSGLPTFDANNGIYVICDKFNSIAYNTARTDVVGILLYDAQGKQVCIKQKEYTTLDEWKQYLASNPITVQYQLAKPITTIIPRTIKRNNNGTISTVDFKTYTNKENLRLPSNPTFLTINSMTSIKPVVEPITYLDFKTRLKTNTDYSVIMDKDSANKTINLGGTSKTYTDKMLVRTPSIDLEQNLRISGNGSIQNIMVIEGDVLDKELPYFNGMCNVKMPIVRNCGRNLCNSNEIVVANAWKSDTQIGDNRVISVCKIEKGGGFGAKVRIKVKPNTTYYIGWEGKNSSFVYIYYNSDVWGNNGSKVVKRNTTFTTLPNTDYITIGLNYISSETSVGYTIITYNLILVEVNNDTNYIPYRGNDICIAQGEIGLSQDMFEQGGINYSVPSNNMAYEQCKSDSSSRLRSKTIFKINGGKTYKLTLNDSSKRFQWYLWGQDGKNLGITGGWSVASNTFTVTVPQEAAYMSLMFRKQDDSTITVNELNLEYFQILELDSTVQLRSLPNGVKDELNLLTGEYIQRVGEVVLDGSQNVVSWWNTTSTIGVSISISTMKNISNLVCDRLPVVYYSDINNSTYDTDGIASWDSGNVVRFRILKSKLTTEDVDGVMSYLQSNPITVQYELAEPIISYPRIVSNTQEREVGVKLPNGVCDTYNPSTGITVKRVGKAILDGSEDWKQGGLTNDTHFEAWLPKSPLKDMKFSYEGFVVGNFTNMIKIDGWAIPYEPTTELIDGKIRVKCGVADDLGAVSIGILKSKLPTQDVAGFKAYLKSNPLTVYYELANPIVTTDIVLPNGVHDEYNPLTGLYTKRVGFIEFDGSETWKFGTTKTNTQVFELVMSKEKLDLLRLKNNIICDKLPTTDESGSDTEKIAYSDSYVDNATTMSIYIALLKTKASTLNELKTYLSQNPIKVWYELATPITYQLTPYFGLPMPYAYKDGYLIMDSAYDGQTLPPEITYQLTVNRTGQITQNNIKLKEHTARLSNLEYMLIEATLDSIFDREMQNFELELMNIKLLDLDE